MKKIYENPMLQVVGIRKNDVIATSLTSLGNEYDANDVTYAPDRFSMFGDSWANAGY